MTEMTEMTVCPVRIDRLIGPFNHSPRLPKSPQDSPSLPESRSCVTVVCHGHVTVVSRSCHGRATSAASSIELFTELPLARCDELAALAGAEINAAKVVCCAGGRAGGGGGRTAAPNAAAAGRRQDSLTSS